jgi:hypothetical protein
MALHRRGAQGLSYAAGIGGSYHPLVLMVVRRHCTDLDQLCAEQPIYRAFPMQDDGMDGMIQIVHCSGKESFKSLTGEFSIATSPSA